MRHPPEVQKVLHYLPQEIVDDLGELKVERASREEMDGVISTYLDMEGDKGVIQLAEGEKVPDAAVVHEVLHHWLDQYFDLDLIEDWAKLRHPHAWREIVDETEEDQELAERDEENFVIDLTSFIMRGNALIDKETPIPDSVKQLFRERFGGKS